MIRLPIKAACPRSWASFAKGKCPQSELYGYFAYMGRVLHNPYMTRKSHKLYAQLRVVDQVVAAEEQRLAAASWDQAGERVAGSSVLFA